MNKKHFVGCYMRKDILLQVITDTEKAITNTPSSEPFIMFHVYGVSIVSSFQINRLRSANKCSERF